jgi:multidrug efflux pump subunit AcrA (membrane-fusion protein)
MKLPGKNSQSISGGWTLALMLLILLPGPAFTAEKEAPRAAPPPPASSDIVFTGKFFCSLKRPVVVPFKGVIISSTVKPGQQVARGEVLAQYSLDPEATLQIQQRLAPPLIKELEGKLAEVQKDLNTSQAKQRELTQLAQNKLAATEAKAQAERDVQALNKQKASLQERLAQARQTAQEDLLALNKLLGSSMKSGQVPRSATLISPINGYIIWINPVLRPSAELEPGTVAFQIGVMDPMLVRAQAYEIEAQQLKQGDVAEVSLESQPERKFQGKLNQLSWAPLTSALDQPSYYEMELIVPNPDLFLKEGLKARVVFHKSR